MHTFQEEVTSPAGVGRFCEEVVGDVLKWAGFNVQQQVDAGQAILDFVADDSVIEVKGSLTGRFRLPSWQFKAVEVAGEFPFTGSLYALVRYTRTAEGLLAPSSLDFLSLEAILAVGRQRDHSVFPGEPPEMPIYYSRHLEIGGAGLYAVNNGVGDKMGLLKVTGVLGYLRPNLFSPDGKSVPFRAVLPHGKTWAKRFAQKLQKGGCTF